MQIKKLLSYFGFVTLLTTILLTLFFIKWIYSPYSYEKAQIMEDKAHQLTAKGELKLASEYFLKSAKINDTNINISRRYRCAGSTSQVVDDKVKYYKLALKYNPNNQNAKNELKHFIKEDK